MPKYVNYWWFVRATYVVDGLFLGDFFWKVVGTVRIHVSHVQLPYTVINVWRINVWLWGGGGGIHMQLPYTVINM